MSVFHMGWLTILKTAGCSSVSVEPAFLDRESGGYKRKNSI
jgi:hypothetical protein